MSIYQSTRVVPYVYMLTHKINGTFYIGYRCANKTPSSTDIVKYRSSSKKVRPNFDQFNWTIIAEFYDADRELAADYAFDLEQELIHAHWGNPLLLNEWAAPVGEKRALITDATRKKRGDVHRGKPKSKSANRKCSETKLGVKDEVVTCPHCSKTGGRRNMTRYHFDNCGKEITTDITREKLRKAATGVHPSEASREKNRKSNTGKKKNYPKTRLSVIDSIVRCPHCGKVGGQRNMTRYHFDNCKALPIIQQSQL